MRQSTNKLGVHHSIAILYQRGLREVVCSPGSRNAPIILAIRAFPEIEVRMVVDERTAAFTALGIAMATGRPCALCCTSGSAVANYYPAVTEAFYQRIPLILLTADRPEDRIDQREGQSIRQKGLFHNHILDEQQINEWSVDQADDLHQSWNICTSQLGPIHWNYPLSEPLYGKSEYPEMQPFEHHNEAIAPEVVNWSSLAEEWKQYGRILFIVGQNSQAEEVEKERAYLQAVQRSFPQVGLFYETLSNLSGIPGVACIDRLVLTIREQEEADLLPDLVVSWGGEWVSRKVKQWLANNKQLRHWHVDPLLHPDILQVPMQKVIGHPTHFLQKVLEHFSPNLESTYAQQLQRASQERAHLACDTQIPWSDLRLFQYLSEKLPEKLHLFNGNSSVVRYIQLFEWPASTFHLGNRGVSGIDGMTATALGYASAIKEEVLLISGDLAFLYDSNAFWQTVPPNFKVLVVNNGGGGIFRIIDGPSESGWLEEHFEQHHSRKAEELAHLYGLPYLRAQSEEELNNVFHSWLSQKGCGILEVFTPRESNNLVLKQYFKKLKNG